MDKRYSLHKIDDEAVKDEFEQKKRKIRNVSWREQRGTVLVESAMTLLGFLVVLLAILEAGRFLNVQQVLTDASREGARLAVSPLSGTSTLPTTEEIENEVQRFLQAANVGSATTVVERPVYIVTGGVPTIYTRVRVSLPYTVLTLSMFSDLEVTLVGEAMMRNETSP
ncbi:MAG: TadE/TadG family type IV pilus assembly protein [Acidobacteriota bacterium]